MLFVLPTPSLQHLAGIKIVTALWNHADILNIILREQPLTLTHTLKWKTIEDQADWNLSALPIPTPLKKQLKSFIKPIVAEISKWCVYHTAHCEIRYNSEWLSGVFPQQFHWTMRGTVDYKKTAEAIVKNETVDVEKRYIVACLNCLENEARRLIQHLSAERRRQLVVANRVGESGFENQLVVFLTCTLSGWPVVLCQYYIQSRYRSRDSMQESLFKESLRCGDRWIWEYLFLQLNSREREKVFNESQDLIPDTFNLYYLSLMSDEQQERAFRQSSENILECLLVWPRQSLFLEAAERGWRFMNGGNCWDDLFCIAANVASNNLDYDYAHLFREGWRLTSSNDQQFFLEYCCETKDLLDSEAVGFIKLVLDETLPSHILALGDRCRDDDDELRSRLTGNDAFHAALKECRAKAELESSNDGSAEEKANQRLKCECLEQLAEMVEKDRESP